MDQQYLFEPIPCDKYDLLTKEEVIELYKGTEELVQQLIKENKDLVAERLKDQQRSFSLSESLYNIKNKLFGKSSEKSNQETKKSK